jgi:hypothetical protein
MKKAYLETSAINYAERSGIYGETLCFSLQSRGFRPAIGIHTIYELAVTFLSPGQAKKAAALFSLVRDLNPAYQPPSDSLLRQEIVKLRTGAAVLPFLDDLEYASAQTEVRRLASGVFDERGRRFVSGRESRIRSEFPHKAARYLQHVINTRANGSVPRIRTFQAAYQYFESSGEIPLLIRRTLHKDGVTESEARELEKRLNEFPAIRALLRANLYISFIFIANLCKPTDDKFDDYRHIIEASYYDAFVTRDKQLLGTVQAIGPHLNPLSADSVLKSVDN